MRRLFLALCVAATANVLAQVPGPSPAPAAPPPAAQESINLLAQAAQDLGVKQCLSAVQRLAAVAIAGSRAHDVLVDWDRANPDKGPFFSLVGVNYQGQSIAATVTAVPSGTDGCSVTAERISVAPFTCESIAQVELKGYRVTRLLPTFAVYTHPSDVAASVSLIDSPPSCLVIRRHVQYSWVDPAKSPASAPR